MRQGRLIGAWVFGLVLAVSGCSDDSGDGSGGSGGMAGSGGTSGSGGMAASGGSGGNGQEDGNFATITVGEMVFDFPPDELNGCNHAANQISGSFAIDDNGNPIQAGGGAGIQVNFAIVTPGSEGDDLPSLSLFDIIPDIRWRAEGIDDARPGVVESWVLNDGRAMGTVTFEVEGTGSGGLDPTVSGEFDILCAGL
jgi:hypothetical protein